MIGLSDSMKITDLKREDYEQVQVNSSRWLSLDNLKNEYWEDIKDFEGLYQVSNYGRVKSLDKQIKVNIRNNEFITIKGCMLHQYKKHGKYWGVALCKNGKHYNKQVHILVAKAFIPNPLNKPCVDHDKSVEKNYCNNCVYNLRWATYKENSEHANLHNRLKRPNKHNKKRVAKIDISNNVVISYTSIRECANQEHISRATLYKILDTNKYYKGFIYKTF